MTGRAGAWSQVAIADIAHFASGVQISVAHLSPQSELAPFPVFGGNGIAGYTETATVNQRTVILGRVGQKCGAVYTNAGPAWVTDNALFARTFKRKVDVGFLAYALENARLNDLKNSNDLPLITQGILRDVKVSIPDSVDEQSRIAGMLADADDLIASFEAMIAKKRDIQQGMMQELLTGRTRLPGFTGGRSEVQLGGAGSTYSGLTGKDKDDFGLGDGLFVTFTEVMAGPCLTGRSLERVRVHPGERQNQVKKGDVLFNGSSETPDEVALAAVVDFDPKPGTFLNSFCFGYRIDGRRRICPAYLAYFFRSTLGRSAVSALAQGATRYNIAKTKLMQLSLLVPPVDEQQAVVDVLRDAEVEIAALKRRLESARAVKTGMMQELLTGRTPLPVAVAS